LNSSYFRRICNRSSCYEHQKRASVLWMSSII